MAVSTYAELKTAVANWLGRSELTSRIPEFISMAEDRIAQELRIRAMETSVDITINAQTEALSTGYLQARRLYIDGDPVRQLELMTPLQFWNRYVSSQTGKPKAFCIEGDNIVFGPSPDATYTGKFLYYKRFTALSADGDTNWLLTNARGLLLYGSLLEAAPYIKNDNRLLTWSAMFDELMAKVKEADKSDRYSGGTLQARSEVSVA